jgi:hypothetical protein
MVRKLSSILILIFLVASSGSSQNTAYEHLWSKNSCGIAPRKFIEDQNGALVGPVLFAEYENDTLRKLHPRLYIFDHNGDTSSISFQKADTLFDIQIIHEIMIEPFGYLLWGKYYIGQTINTEAVEVLVRTDYEFNILWEKHLNLGYNYVATCREVLQTEYNELLLACSPDRFNMYLYKISNNGDSLDFRYYGGDNAGAVQSLTYNSDSSAYLLHTYGSHWQHGASLNRMIEIDSSLNQVNVLKYPDWYDMSYKTVLWENDQFLSGGDEWVANTGVTKKYFTAYILNDTLGTVTTTRLTNPDTNSTSAWWRNLDTKGSYVYLGGSFDGEYHSSNDTSWYYIAMLDENLDLVYEKYIGGDKHYWCECVTATSDGGVFLSGICFDIDSIPQFYDAFFVKLDTTGLPLNILDDFHQPQTEVNVYPNPGNNKINIRHTQRNCWIEIYSNSGSMVVKEPLSSGTTTVSTSGLKPGVYIYLIKNEFGKLHSGKWIKY